MMPRQADFHTTFTSWAGDTLEDVTGRAGQRLNLARLVLWAAGGMAIGLATQTVVRQVWLQPQQPLIQAAPALPVVAIAGTGLAPAGSAAASLPPVVRHRPVHAVPAPSGATASTTGVVSAPVLPSADPPGLSHPAAIEADILVDGVPLTLDNSHVVLPTGTRLQVRLRSDQSGTVVIHTISPAGAVSATPLWQSTIRAGQSLLSASMRLHGARGLETLQVLLTGPDGQVRGHRQLQFWHM